MSQQQPPNGLPFFNNFFAASAAAPPNVAAPAGTGTPNAFSTPAMPLQQAQQPNLLPPQQAVAGPAAAVAATSAGGSLPPGGNNGNANSMNGFTGVLVPQQQGQTSDASQLQQMQANMAAMMTPQMLQQFQSQFQSQLLMQTQMATIMRMMQQGGVGGVPPGGFLPPAGAGLAPTGQVAGLPNQVSTAPSNSNVGAISTGGTVADSKPDPAREYTNDKTYNVSDIARNHITKSKYFQDLRSKCATVSELVLEVERTVDHTRPYQSHSQSEISSFMVCFFRLCQLRPSTVELHQLCDHENPFVRCVAFVFMRHVFDAKKFWGWISPFLTDTQEISSDRLFSTASPPGGTINSAAEPAGTSAVPGTVGGSSSASSAQASFGTAAFSSRSGGNYSSYPYHDPAAPPPSTSTNSDYPVERIGEFLERLVNSDKYDGSVLMPRFPTAVKNKKAAVLAVLDVVRERYQQNEQVLEEHYGPGALVDAFVEDAEGAFSWKAGEVVGIAYGAVFSNVRLRVRFEVGEKLEEGRGLGGGAGGDGKNLPSGAAGATRHTKASTSKRPLKAWERPANADKKEGATTSAGTNAGAAPGLENSAGTGFRVREQLVGLGLIVRKVSSDVSGDERQDQQASTHTRGGGGSSRRSRSPRRHHHYHEDDLTVSRGDEKLLRRRVEHYIEANRTGAVAVGRDYATKPPGYKAMLACQRSNLGTESRRLMEEEAGKYNRGKKGSKWSRDGSERTAAAALQTDRLSDHVDPGSSSHSGRKGGGKYFVGSGNKNKGKHQSGFVERAAAEVHPGKGSSSASAAAPSTNAQAAEMERRQRMAAIMARYTANSGAAQRAGSDVLGPETLKFGSMH